MSVGGMRRAVHLDHRPARPAGSARGSPARGAPCPFPSRRGAGRSRRSARPARRGRASASGPGSRRRSPGSRATRRAPPGGGRSRRRAGPGGADLLETALRSSRSRRFRSTALARISPTIRTLSTSSGEQRRSWANDPVAMTETRRPLTESGIVRFDFSPIRSAKRRSDSASGGSSSSEPTTIVSPARILERYHGEVAERVPSVELDARACPLVLRDDGSDVRVELVERRPVSLHLGHEPLESARDLLVHAVRRCRGDSGRELAEETDETDSGNAVAIVVNSQKSRGRRDIAWPAPGRHVAVERDSVRKPHCIN